jgi:hypothetical protein
MTCSIMMNSFAPFERISDVRFVTTARVRSTGDAARTPHRLPHLLERVNGVLQIGDIANCAAINPATT